MDTPKARISPLRQRMLDDMRLRRLSPKTQSGYIRAVRNFTQYLGRSPDTATVEELRNYQLHLVDSGTSPISINAAIFGLKFFFDITLDRGELMARMQPVRVPQKLPVVLSREEVKRLIAACRSLKHQIALSVAYGAGLRASEVAALKVSDIDSDRMILRIEQGKGHKDRYAILSPGVDPSFIDDAIRRLVETSAYLDDRPNVPLRFLTEANLTQMVRRQEQTVDRGEVRVQLNDRISVASK